MRIKITTELFDNLKRYILSRDIMLDCIPRMGEWIEVRIGLISKVTKVRWVINGKYDVIIKLAVISCTDASYEGDTLKEALWYDDTQDQ